MDDLVYWLWLSLSLPPASPTFARLYAHTPSAKGIFDMDADTVRRLAGTHAKDAERLLSHDLAPAEHLLAFCRRKEIGLLPYSSELYPPLLRNIDDPPVLLYYRGHMPDLSCSFPCAVVGMRRMTEYGRRSAFHISLDLARAGATLVSGMARGIDGVSLAAACAVGRPSVAVFGCGIDICYPKEHLTLAREIVKYGAIVTEYPPGTPAYSFHFPQRNRIISGMCAAVAVIEGREESGSLITARCATAQGRTVYAMPGNIDAETSEGTSLLLKNGARVLTAADDILREFEFVYTGIINPYLLNEPVSVRMEDVLRRLDVGQKRRRTDRPSEPPEGEPKTPTRAEGASEQTLAAMTEAQRRLYERIPADDSCDVEELCETGLSMPAVMRELLALELLRCIEMLPGERVKRT